MSIDDKMKNLTDALCKRSLRFDVINVKGGFLISLGFMNLKMPFSRLDMVMHLDDDALQTFVPIPRTVTGREGKVFEFFNMINYCLKYGRFEVDLQNGEARFHLVESSDILVLPSCVRKAIERQVNLPIAMIKYIAPGFLRLLDDEACTAAMAVRICRESK